MIITNPSFPHYSVCTRCGLKLIQFFSVLWKWQCPHKGFVRIALTRNWDACYNRRPTLHTTTQHCTQPGTAHNNPALHTTTQYCTWQPGTAHNPALHMAEERCTWQRNAAPGRETLHTAEDHCTWQRTTAHGRGPLHISLSVLKQGRTNGLRPVVPSL